MTAEEYLAKMRDPHWYGEQDENGVDLSLIKENLALSYEERLIRGDRGRRSALELRKHVRTERDQERSEANR
jgi:hypothetical protein